LFLRQLNVLLLEYEACCLKWLHSTSLTSEERVIFMVFDFLYNKNMSTWHVNLISIPITTTFLNSRFHFYGKISVILKKRLLLLFYISEIYENSRDFYRFSNKIGQAEINSTYTTNNRLNYDACLIWIQHRKYSDDACVSQKFAYVCFDLVELSTFTSHHILV
jgi:hypothetical protein